MSDMNWRQIYYGPVTRKEVQEFIPEEHWQQTRLYMKGKTLQEKYITLRGWLIAHDFDRRSQVQVTNYITALSRGGLIKPRDYLYDITEMDMIWGYFDQH